ncbi:MAG: hypothetical protein Q4A66_11555 [Eubacteriales bacterium]|nr:hypothetical protein [Eubacteriales bacterium]
MKTRPAAALLLAAMLIMCGGAFADDGPGAGPGVAAVLANEPGLLESFEPFLRIDGDYADAWTWDLDNLRVFAQVMYEFGEAKEKYGLDLTYPVSTEGLDDLHASASAQFSEKQFRELADTLRAAADGKKVVIVDLREESHYFLNGISISSFKLHNWGNLGLEQDEIESAEAELFKAMLGKTVTAYMEDDEEKQEEQLAITVESVMSERELVESEGFTYLRLAVTDHAWPTPDEIDRFIECVKTMGMEDTWFHFHCYAGQGRTGAYLALYDKMKNPDVDTQDILYRHAMTGSNYPLYLGSEGSYKAPLYAEKAEMMPMLMQYVEENHEGGYAVSWSEWLAEQDA